jgi:hypothetical protein
MAKKSTYLFYIILALSLIIFGCLSLTFFKINIIEGASSTSNNADDFSVAMNITLNSSKGKIVPYPIGSYTVTTTSGKYSATTDFSMNKPAVYVKTNYDVDASKNIVNRIITVSPKDTGGSTNINIRDVITNKFILDISFNQIGYKLNTMADLKARDLPYENLNYIDGNNNLIITSLGAIYDKNKKKIGSVNMDDTDMNNEKTYAIVMENQEDRFLDIKKIIITFIIPLPLLASVPAAPPPIDPKLIAKLPKLDPNMSDDKFMEPYPP